MSKDDGGQAFPVSYDGHAGMSLRDWFAGQALAGLVAKHGTSLDNAGWLAYAYADAMLEERSKK